MQKNHNSSHSLRKRRYVPEDAIQGGKIAGAAN